jgi:hypothetical protein
MLLCGSFATCSDKSGPGHMAGKSPPSFLVLFRSLSAVKLCLLLSEINFFSLLWNETLLQSCNVFYVSKKCILLKIDINAFKVFMFVLLIFLKCFEPNTHFTSKTDLKVHDIQTPLYFIKEMMWVQRFTLLSWIVCCSISQFAAVMCQSALKKCLQRCASLTWWEDKTWAVAIFGIWSTRK